MTDNSDYERPRTNLYDLLPEVYKSGVNQSVLETTINRFLTKSETDTVIGYVGQGNPNALINHQIQEPTPQRQAYQLQPMIYSKIGTIEHMASWKDIENEATRLGVDSLRMQEWGNATKFNWAPPVDYDKIINYRDYFWYNPDDSTASPQYITIQNRCTRAEAKLDEYNNLLDDIGAIHAIVGLDADARTITINQDLTANFTEGFIFYVKNSTNTSINQEFFVVESSFYTSGSDTTNIVVQVSGSPPFDDSIVDGDVSLEEGTSVLESARDCQCNGALGWSGGLWDDNQVGDVLWNTDLLLEIEYATEADWIAANCTGSPCPVQNDLWYDTTTDTLKQYDGSAWVIVQSNFSTLLAVTSGGEAWDLSELCQFETNEWIEQNKWLHKNQVPNFSIAKQAQLPILEYLPTVELNEWTEITYDWRYRVTATTTFEDAPATRPTIFELIGVEDYVIDANLQELVIDSRYGDMTSILPSGTEFDITSSTDNDARYTVDYSFFCEEVIGDKLQTRVRIIEIFTSTTADGLLTPAVTSMGDAYAGRYVQWVYVSQAEAFAVGRIAENPQLELPVNPPLPTVSDTYWDYEVGPYAQHLTITTTSLGKLSIISATTGASNYWEVSGDHTAALSDSSLVGVGGTITVEDNIGGGNSDYTITAVTLVSGNTQIEVSPNTILSSAASASTLGTLFAHWTFTFDSTLQDETLVDSNDLRIYLEDDRQYGNYDELSVGGSPTPDCDYVGGVIVHTSIEKFQSFLAEVGAAADTDIGYNWIDVRTDENDGTFNASTDLECISLVQFKKLEQTKIETNQYPLFDIYDVEGNSLNEANNIFAYQESQDSPVNTNVGKRIVTEDNGREYFFEQFLTPEDDGMLYTYHEESTQFWYDSDNFILYQAKNGTWNDHILTSEFATGNGSPAAIAYYIEPIVSDMAPTSPYIGIDGMLWYNTLNDTINVSDGTSWSANSTLTSVSIKGDADPGLYAIWKPGPTDVPCEEKDEYVPEWVDGDRNALSVGDTDGDWEIPDQLYFNALHENRKVLSYTELFNHFTSIIDSQDVPPGFTQTSAQLYHTITEVDFGAGGTIKEFNYSHDSYISSIFNQTVNPPQLYEFAHDAYETALSQIKEFYRRDVLDVATDVSDDTVADLSTSVTDTVIGDYESNDAANFVFGDTTAYDADTGLGVKNWPATLPFFKLVHKVQPQQIYDPASSLSELRHHDGHFSHIEVDPTTTESFNRKVVSTDDTRSTNTFGKMGTSEASLPPELFSTYQGQFGNTSAIYWHDISTKNNRILYRMVAVRVGNNAPAVDLPEGTFWYHLSANQLKILQSGVWVNDPNVGPGLLSDFGNGYAGAWDIVDTTKLLSDAIFEVENRLWVAAPTTVDLIFDFEGTFNNDPSLTDEYFEEAFASFLVQAGILDPFTNILYDSEDPYTWNYKTADPPSSQPQVGSTYVSGGTWQDVYQKQYGTPYPHFEPWVLQGYPTEPDWWSATYDPAGSPAVDRRWTETMWQNILDGVVPVSESLPNGNVSTGVVGEVNQYNYISVNMDDNVVLDPDGNAYASDGLLPPTVTLPIIGTTFPVRSLWSDTSQVPNQANDYAYDDAGLVEWTWEDSSQYLYDALKVAFRLQPVRFIHSTLGIDFIAVGCLNVDQDSQKVYAHQNARFHGDLLSDNTVYSVNGTLQWYTNFNRFTGYDMSSSNFRDLWTGWDVPLSYQFAAVVDTESFLIANRLFDVVDTDYDITLKRSPGIDDHELDALKVVLLSAPPVLIGQDTESQWLFDVSTFSPRGRPLNFYGSQKYEFTVDDVTDIFTTTDIFGRDMPWEDDDAVQVTSTEFLPSPLLADTVYYVNKVGTNQFKLSEESGGPTIDILSTGVGTHAVFQIARSFTALRGKTTEKDWYHIQLDKDLVLTLLPPSRVTGLQNLISIIDGYAAYSSDEENFEFNLGPADLDIETSDVSSWQLEEERLIDWAYTSRSGSYDVNDTYGVEADNSTDEFTYTEQVPGAWNTGMGVNVFTENGGTLPQPLLDNVTYYLIVGDDGTFKLAVNAREARNDNAIDILTDGSNLRVRETLKVKVLNFFEVNPFRYNIWIRTPQGIVADLNKGPFADVRTDPSLLDQFARALPTDGTLALRQDKLTHINIFKGIKNDITPFAPRGQLQEYNELHLTSAHIYIDGYEHVILFQDYAAATCVIYDAFLGINTSRFDLQFERNNEFTLRPNLGGAVLVDDRNTTGRTAFAPNIEAQIDNLRYAYDTYRTEETNRMTTEARRSLGYEGTRDYMYAINVNPKSQFIFWRGMIQQKGSVNSVKAFINSRRFIDAKIDEFWAQKIIDFGSTDEFTLPELNLFSSDGTLTEFRIEFVDPGETADVGFEGISNVDIDRWYEYPNQKAFLDKNGNMYFNAESTSVDSSPTFILNTGVYYYVTNEVMDSVVITYFDSLTDSTVRLVEGTDYDIINSQTVKFTTNPNTYPDITIYTINPAKQRHNPVKVRNKNLDRTITSVIIWDPIRDDHYHNAIHLVDVKGDGDPATIEYGYSSSLDTSNIGGQSGPPVSDYPYGSSALDTTWLDTSILSYVPYHDVRVFPDTIDRLRRWGKLADFAEYLMYQWTESPVIPSEYDALAEQQEGDITIDERYRLNGRVRQAVYEGSGGSPNVWTEYPYEVYSSPSRKIYDVASSPSWYSDISTSRPASLYKNGVFDSEHTSSASVDAAVSGFTDKDHIDVVKFYPTDNQIDDVTFIKDTPYTEEQTNENGVPVTKYYFWVGDKSVRQIHRNKTVSITEAQIQLNNVPVPFVIIQKFDSSGSPLSTTVPRRYVQAVVRGLSTYVNADDTYTLRFTRDFTYRDNLTTSDELYGPDSPKVRHQEWRLFRQEQPFKVDRNIWNLLTESIIGQTLDSLNSAAVRVPSLDKELYDIENLTSTRFGFAAGQSFCDGVLGWEAILSYLQDGRNNFAPVDINAFFQTFDPLSLTPRNPDDAQEIADIMNVIYDTFTFENVNRMWFSTLLTAALTVQSRYKDLFKTSYVALHGIRILETAGLFDD